MATQTASFERVQQALIALEIPAEEITPDVNIRDELDVDSTELVEIAVTLGRECGVEINAKAVKGVETVADLVRLLDDRPLHHTEHATTIAAPADAVYDVLADVEGYARLFPPTQEVEMIEEGDGYQIARLVVDVSGEVQSWVTRRDLDPERKVIAYRQLETAALVGRMGGEWRVYPIDEQRTQLVLTHDFVARAPESDGKVAGRFTPDEADELLRAAVERNSHDDLAAVKTEAQRRTVAAV